MKGSNQHWILGLAAATMKFADSAGYFGFCLGCSGLYEYVAIGLETSGFEGRL